MIRGKHSNQEYDLSQVTSNERLQKSRERLTSSLRYILFAGFYVPQATDRKG